MDTLLHPFLEPGVLVTNSFGVSSMKPVPSAVADGSTTIRTHLLPQRGTDLATPIHHYVSGVSSGKGLNGNS